MTDEANQNFETQENLEIAPFQTKDISVKAKLFFTKYKKIILLAGFVILLLVSLPFVQNLKKIRLPIPGPQATPTSLPTPTPEIVHLKDAELDIIYQSVLQLDADLEKVDLKETGLKTPELEKNISF